jgi:hypothetical protein
MKYNYKNTLIALLITIIIILSSTLVINNFSNNKYTSKSNDNIKSPNIVNEYSDKEGSSIVEKVVNNRENIVIKDTSTSEAIEKSNVSSDIPVDNNTTIDNQSIQYFEGAEMKIDSMTNNIDKMKTEGKALFVKLVDFIFYDKPINGIKFKDLTSATQEKLISIVNSIDNKIESKAPGYKETVVDYSGRTYTYLGVKLKQGITYIDSKIEQKVNSEIYNNVKETSSEAVDTMKESFGTAIDISKKALQSGKEKVKNWYEGWK